MCEREKRSEIQSLRQDHKFQMDKIQEERMSPYTYFRGNAKDAALERRSKCGIGQQKEIGRNPHRSALAAQRLSGGKTSINRLLR